MMEFLNYTTDTKVRFAESLTPNQFVCKPWFIGFVFEHSDTQIVFLIDSGIMTFDNTGFF